jgi:hypothetical protein
MVNLLTDCTTFVTVRSSTLFQCGVSKRVGTTGVLRLRDGSVDQRIFGRVEGCMGTCSYCGTAFPKTRKSRKYCTNRCKTNACLDKKPRLRAADVEAIHELLHADFASVDALRERLRAIVAPELPEIPLVDGRAAVPRMD